MINGRRIATATGAMLSDPAGIGNLPQDAQESLFDPKYWSARGELVAVTGGRGAAWFIASGARQWVLRHFRRGGLVARLSEDGYVWAGENKVRAFVEWRLLELLTERGLPVPKPVAARYSRAGLLYRCDLITQRIMAAEPLSAVLAQHTLPDSVWHVVGATVARLHRAGVDHADLNAHNLLLDACGQISVIDFDRGRMRAPGEWRGRNLQRLRRSLLKVSTDLPAGRFSDAVWRALLAGYRAK